ncbi:MAG: hypothetical protein K9G61_07020 [Bacteroidales bacterium]|nr:hypothetical protein [Bacteroidales bacterium]
MIGKSGWYNPFYKGLRVAGFLSLDVILGVGCMGIFAAHLLESTVPQNWLLLLLMAAWVMYTADHLVDAQKRKSLAVNPRHVFHYQYRKQLTLILVLVSLVVLITSLLSFSAKTLVTAMGILLVVGVYFSLLRWLPEKQKKFIPKELIIALIYVSGIWFIPLLFSTKTNTGHIVLILFIILLVWIETTIASWYEYKTDVTDGHHSFTTVFGKERTRRILKRLVLLTISLLIISGLFFTEVSCRISFLLLLIVASGLLLLMFKPGYFEKNERYRLMGESLFYLPALIVFI